MNRELLNLKAREVPTSGPHLDLFFGCSVCWNQPARQSKPTRFLARYEELRFRPYFVFDAQYCNDVLQGNIIRTFAHFLGLPTDISQFNISPSSSQTPDTIRQAPRSSHPYSLDSLSWNFEERPV